MVSVSSVFFILLLHIAMACEYAKVGDPEKKHTMCKYSGPKEGCPITKRGLDTDEIALLVKLHNEYRQKVASGNQANQPAACNMKELKWDNELATIAQRWADQCEEGHDDNNASKDKYQDFNGAVGQNAYQGGVSFPIRSAVDGWFSEVKNMKPAYLKSFPKDDATLKKIGHYTQMIWADTEDIGCGAVIFSGTRHIVCNYGPSGNYEEEPTYDQGKCNCPRSDSYKALCK